MKKLFYTMSSGRTARLGLNVTVNAILVLTLAACEDFLKVDPPKSKVKSEVVFTSDVTATSSVLGIYGDLLGSGSFASGDYYSVLSLTGLSGDELINYPKWDVNSVEFEQNEISPANPVILTLWTSLYRAIYEANAVIEGLNSSKGLSELTKSQLEGEGYFIRAFCHFYLINMFGDVPLVLTTDYQTNSRIPRSPKLVVYDQIVADLIKAQELLQSNYVAAQSERIRPNRFTATALLARVYLYLGEWSKAEIQSTSVIENTALYSLKSDLNDVFLKNSTEAIWQLRPNVNGDNGYTYEGLYFSPNEALNYNVINSAIIDSFEDNDQRTVEWVGSLNDGTGTVYFPYKYKQANFDEPLTEYSMVLRLAEQYLIRAEARAMLNNLTGPNSASSDLNEIRNRAGLSDASSTSQTELLADILDERRIELLAEWGHRWFDLKRLGLSASVLGAIKDDFSATDELYPIPQSEFLKNQMLGDQNQGY